MKILSWQKNLLRWLLSGLCAISFLATSAAWAQTSLPSSDYPVRGIWKDMHPSSFEGTLKSVAEQCLRDEAVSNHDPLTKEKCRLLVEMLKNNQCTVEMVRDDIVFDILNGRMAGQSHVWFNMQKSIGREDRALLCDLGDGVFSYWFTGVRGQSCNNLAFVFKRQPVVVPEPPQPVVIQPEQHMPYTGVVRSGSVEYLPGVNIDSCCCGGGINIPAYFNANTDGDGLQSRGSSKVDW